MLYESCNFSNPNDSFIFHLDKLNQNKDHLSEYQGAGNRRLTLPELPRIETTNVEQVKGYAISQAQSPKGDSTSAAVKRKNSLPENVKSATVSLAKTLLI